MNIKIDKKTYKRIQNEIKVFKKILIEAKERDINESDTVTIIVDILVNIFGYDRYKEITKEYSIKGTFCDLAVKIDNKPKILIEVKAIGIELKDQHIRQATDYGVREGIQWVILTNGIFWNIYRVGVKNSIKIEPIINFNLTEINIKDKENELFSLCREGIKKSAIDKIYEYQAIVNKYCISALIFSDDIKKVLIKKIRELSKGTKVNDEDIDELLNNEIIKRDVLENDEFLKYKKKEKRKQKKIIPIKTENNIPIKTENNNENNGNSSV